MVQVSQAHAYEDSDSDCSVGESHPEASKVAQASSALGFSWCSFADDQAAGTVLGRFPATCLTLAAVLVLVFHNVTASSGVPVLPSMMRCPHCHRDLHAMPQDPGLIEEAAAALHAAGTTITRIRSPGMQPILPVYRGPLERQNARFWTAEELPPQSPRRRRPLQRRNARLWTEAELRHRSRSRGRAVIDLEGLPRLVIDVESDNDDLDIE